MENKTHDASQKVLVVAPAWVGDLVLSQSVYMALVRQGAEVDVLAPEWAEALLARMPEVSTSYVMPAAHGELQLAARYRLGVKIRARRHNRAIILPRSLKSALVPWFARIPGRTGYRGEMRYGLINDMRPLHRDKMPRIVERFVYLTNNAAPGTSGEQTQTTVTPPALRVDEENRTYCMRKAGLTLKKRVLAMMPGAAYGPSKRWPPEYFAKVAAAYLNEDWQVWLFGAASDRVIADEIMRHIRQSDKAAPEETRNNLFNLCGKTRLQDAVDLLSCASFAVTNDSGLMHIAAAVGCPLVAMYGATATEYTPPMVTPSQQMRHPIHCAPCWKRTCRYGHYRCLTEIKPDDVIREIRRIVA